MPDFEMLSRKSLFFSLSILLLLDNRVSLFPVLESEIELETVDVRFSEFGQVVSEPNNAV